mgnify:CR=1 FL=1
MIRRRTSTALAAVALALTAPALAGCGGSEGGSASALPDVQLTSVGDGSTIDASELRGPALVNLWATWCGPCRAEMPAFQAVASDLGDVRVIGINEGDAGDKAAGFLDDVGVTFDQYLDPDSAISAELRVSGLPATLVVDADGHVVEIHSGALDEDGIRDLAATLAP